MEDDDWCAWARDTLGYLGIPAERTRELGGAELRMNLSYRIGTALGTLAKCGFYRAYLDSFRETTD